MKTYTPEELKEIVRLHGMWLRNEAGGKKADLHDAYLCNANLHGADLTGANLTGANLIDANLIDANLSGANLIDANLCNANLIDANLTGADLYGANLTSCNGVQYVQFSFQGLGSESRQWSAVKLDNEWKVFCGCWSGTLEELQNRISKEKAEEIKLTGYTDVSTSREVAYETMVRLCQESDRRNITKL